MKKHFIRNITKAISVFICMIMLVSLAACGKNDNAAKPADPGPNAEVVAQDVSPDDFEPDEMEEFVKASPNYKDKLEQDLDLTWEYDVNGAKVHLRTNIWDYITYSGYVEGEVTKTKSGKTYKIDFGKMADDFGWKIYLEGFGNQAICYEGCHMQPFLDQYLNPNKFGFYPICKYVPFLWDQGVDKAVFVPVFWGESPDGGAMSYEHVIAVTYAIESTTKYCDTHGVDSFNEGFDPGEDRTGWFVNTILPELSEFFGPDARGGLMLNNASQQ